MTDSPTPRPRRPRLVTAIVVAAVVLVVIVVAGIGLLTAGTASPGSTTGAPGAAASSGPAAPPSSAAPTHTAPAPKPVKTTAAPTPQPTRTATITKPTAVPIKKAFTATVVRMEAVKGVAEGPGEIGGPSVRFTVKITNTTGKTVSLTETVVNAFYGSAQTPAVQLRQPNGKDFPHSVKNGSSATGVFIFNIPVKSRSDVRITVDTSVKNPVIAFEGSAPRS